ncbi:intracellular protein transport protein USO1-like [Nicotiana sylvestris]|uniref:intracellular protein transport protein USO1-like n=1 Tax=Nicotiana sylvestris TaxID=4096 RepID=UPI00388CA044
MPKTRKEYTDADRKVVEKNFRAKKILVCGIGPDEYNKISACQSAKEIWEALQTAHEGITQVKQSKIDMLTTEYELFWMKDDESIQDMHTRLTSIINELHSLGEIIPRNKLVRKILSILPSSWESKVNVITEAKDLHELTIDELVRNLNTYKMKKKIDSKRRELKKEKNLVLKAEGNDSSEEDCDMAYLTKRFQNYDLYHKCGKPGHFVKECPLLKQEHFKYNPDKAAKRNPVPDKHFKRKNVADNVVKQALAAWGDSFSEFDEETDTGDSSMMAVESGANEYDSIFALMTQSDDDEDDEVNFRDVQRNLKSYSPKKLMSLENVLIDAYHSLIDDKDALTIELGDAEQTRDDLVVCVVDLKETIDNLENEKKALIDKITSVEHERDDLVVVVVDLKETIEKLSKEKDALVDKITVIEQERDDLLIVIADLREII